MHISLLGFLIKLSYDIYSPDKFPMQILEADVSEDRSVLEYRKIPIISPGLIFVHKAVLLGLFWGELTFGGAYYWKEFCVSKLVGLDNKNSLKDYENSLKQLKTANHKSPRAYIWEGFLFFGGGGGGLLSEF